MTWTVRDEWAANAGAVAMRLDPDAAAVWAFMVAAVRPPVTTLTPAEARAGYSAMRKLIGGPPDAVASVEAASAPGPAGPVPLRLYRGAGTHPDADLPALIYFHGGGWVIGDLDSHDGVCRVLANTAGCAVISVDYRLAPEHRFPAAVEDSAAASRWVFEQARSLRIDASRIAVGGDSAGGNLAAVMALMARDGTLPPFCQQVLFYPVTDLRMAHSSYAEFTADLPLTASGMAWFIDHYAPSASDRDDWRASPLRCASLAGVAPALVMTAAYDPLRDEGEDYASRLERDGAAVTRLRFSDQFHGFLTMAGMINAATVALGMAGLHLRRAFYPRSQSTP